MPTYRIELDQHILPGTALVTTIEARTQRDAFAQFAKSSPMFMAQALGYGWTVSVRKEG
jgi:hypothetical protein